MPRATVALTDSRSGYSECHPGDRPTDHVQFSCTALARIVLNGYVERCQRTLASNSARSGLPPETLRAVEEHHERWDGRGFPKGLRRGEISPFAQVIAITRAYHSLLSWRPYRPALTTHEAGEFIVASAAERFDPELAEFFVRRVPQYPRGLCVRLSTGESAFVIDPKVGHVARPVVRVFSRGERRVAPYDLDLSSRENMTKIIVGTVD